ncbi:putative strictosidine synthase transcription factor WD40-like family [Heracleum sosnowskyi]|uniref:Strictosidine synthase transcription factor WD40-like family n=1 Tax=Heracleum sosnowskyi TaxID=360622 RepID=A0AAD8HH17_9APIA|nr:putative strictosidine synthase transcription factor WD40-like family [Heracleum sosnowskyi]
MTNSLISNAVVSSSILSHRTVEEKSRDYNDDTHQFQVMPIVSAFGPESFAFDVAGEGPYTGVSDSRIIKWNQSQRLWTNFSVMTSDRNGGEGPHDHTTTEDVCGRSLGLCSNKKTGDLYIVDTYMGLLVVGPNGGLGLATKLTSEAQGVLFKYTNGVEVDDITGDVYFTDSSSVYSRGNTILALSGDRTAKQDSHSEQAVFQERNAILLQFGT